MYGANGMLGGVADVVLPTENALRDLYERKRPLAGAHSRSVEARHIETGITFALREFHMAELTTTRLAQLRAAVTAWRKLDNPADEEAARFPRLHEVLASPTRLHVVCEISGPPGCCPVDLHTLIEQRGRLADGRAGPLRFWEVASPSFGRNLHASSGARGLSRCHRTP